MTIYNYLNKVNLIGDILIIKGIKRNFISSWQHMYSVTYQSHKGKIERIIQKLIWRYWPGITCISKKGVASGVQQLKGILQKLKLKAKANKQTNIILVTPGQLLLSFFKFQQNFMHADAIFPFTLRIISIRSITKEKRIYSL